MGTKDQTHDAIANALTNGSHLTQEQRGLLFGLVADDKFWQRECDKANAERHDLALLVLRLSQRLRAARAGKGVAAGDETLIRGATDYLVRKGLTSPLRGEGPNADL